MRILFILIAFYIGLIAFGMNTAFAGRGGACSDPTCTEKEISESALNRENEDLIAKIQELLDLVEAKIGMEKLQSVIQQAAEKNPQIADMLKIIQEYGVLTEITLDEVKETP